MLVLYAVCAVLIITVWSSWRSYIRLKHFDGPLFGSLSIWWIISRIRSGVLHIETARVCSKYGSIARIGPNHLVTTDSGVWRQINASRSKWTKSSWYDSMNMDPMAVGKNVLAERDLERHSKLRAKLAPGYSGKATTGLEARVDRQLLQLLDLIERKYLSTDLVLRKVDFAQKAQFFTIDTITDIAMDAPFGDLSRDEDVHDYIRTTEENLALITQISALPAILQFMESGIRLAVRLFPALEDKVGLGQVTRVAKTRVAERFAKPETKGDMLNSFIEKGLSQRQAEAETTVQIVAGSDTTATAIRSTLLYIVTHPATYYSLRREIDSVACKGSIISDAEARALPYLQACIKEGLRMCPPITGLLEKEAPPEGDHLDGKYVPGGTHIGLCIWGLLRDEEVFGESAQTFNPERWLSQKEGVKLDEMERALDLVFGYGQNSCLGRSIARMELNKVFFELLRRYDISIVDPYRPIKSINAGLFLQSQMYMRFAERTDRKATS